jgi:c-di-GMP-binding flagellar brake protein YcgR
MEKIIMKDTPPALLKKATPDELLSCIQLLAISVVQHRAKCGFVTLNSSTEELRALPEKADETGVFLQGKEVLEEALEMVRALAAESNPSTPSPEEAEPDNTSAENRTQFRIRLTTPIKVLWPQDSKPVAAQLEDISWGGASIRVDEVKVESGEKMRVILPRVQGGSISIEAKILRSWQDPSVPGHRVAIRFSSLSTHDETKLEAILEDLAQSADAEGQRNYARLTQRLDIQFDGVQELQSTLDDISAGGMGVTVPDPLKIGQSLQTVISTLDETCSLKLRARVVRQEPLKQGRRVKAYRVGLKFEHPSAELKRRTSDLIRKMATMRND